MKYFICYLFASEHQNKRYVATFGRKFRYVVFLYFFSLFFLSRWLSIFYDEHSFLVFFHSLCYFVLVSFVWVIYHCTTTCSFITAKPQPTSHNICLSWMHHQSVAAISRRNSIINQLHDCKKGTKAKRIC